MVMPPEVLREVTSSSAVSGPVPGNRRVPWPMTTGPRPLTDLAAVHDEAVAGRLPGKTVLIP